MADSDPSPPEDVFHQQAQDSLPFAHFQRVRPRPQAGTEGGECFGEPQIIGLIGASGLQRLPFGLHRLLLLAQFRHANPQLL